jgi:UDP-N-acetylglucosamine:LPS N-acetylglucosamine transferase
VTAVTPSTPCPAPLLAITDPTTTVLLSALAPFLGRDGRARRVHVVSGSFGAGHDAAAHEVSRRLASAGHHVDRWDVVDLFPGGLGRLVRFVYLRQLSVAPKSWGVLLRHLEPGTLASRMARGSMQSARHRVARIADEGADLFVSTHPFASQVLGDMRESGALTAPVVTYLTDASVHPLWVHPAVDLHLGLHDVAVAAARALGGRSEVIAPLVPDTYRTESAWSESARLAVREALGLRADQAMVLLVGGSLGVGDLLTAAREVRDSGVGVAVVACGTNERLRRQLERLGGVVPLPWRDDLSSLIRSADCVVQNAGGFSAWEALAAGTPLVTYRPVPGHGTTNAAALEEAGLVPWVRSPAALPAGLLTAMPAEPVAPVGLSPVGAVA